MKTKEKDYILLGITLLVIGVITYNLLIGTITIS